MKLFSQDRIFIERRIRRSKRIVLFLDYDGTLVPIAATPQQARMPESTKALLARLSRLSGVRVAIITGRSLRTIKKMVGLKELIYAGNHGLELCGRGLRLELPGAVSLKKIFLKIRKQLFLLEREFAGVLVEDKDLTWSVHYRKLKKHRQEEILLSRVQGILKPFVLRGQVRLTFGKKVMEIRPNINWHKGKIVSWLLRQREVAGGLRKNVFVMCFGDDTTDEDVFRQLRKAVTVYVGAPKKSCARYRVRKIDDVLEILRGVVEAKEGAHG